MSEKTPETENDHNLLQTVTVASAAILAVLIIGGWIIGSRQTAAGIACGGLLALGNNLWLRRNTTQALGLEPRQAGRFAIVRYLLRLALLAGMLYLLIVRIGIDIIGLIIGLSVLVIVIIGAALFRAARTGG